jgi:hypothetical protein
VVLPGDLLLKHDDGSWTSWAIKKGQKWFGRGVHTFTHAGIASDPDHIYEMQGEGLCYNDLSGHNSHYTYDLFRCKIPQLAAGAAVAAEMMYMNFSQQGIVAGVDERNAQAGGVVELPTANKIKYTIPGAAGSIWSHGKFKDGDVANTKIDSMLGTGKKFFCSGFVVLCYQMAATQSGVGANLFKLKDTAYQPAYLWEELFHSPQWTRVGTIRMGQLV